MANSSREYTFDGNGIEKQKLGHLRQYVGAQDQDGRTIYEFLHFNPNTPTGQFRVRVFEDVGWVFQRLKPVTSHEPTLTQVKSFVDKYKTQKTDPKPWETDLKSDENGEKIDLAFTELLKEHEGRARRELEMIKQLRSTSSLTT